MHRGLTALASSLLLALVSLPGGARADVAVNHWTPMPAQGTFTLTGHGYGHGHGMSQYGAEGAARQGLTWQQIVRFYYPGTAFAQHRPTVRVLISADTTPDVAVLPRTGLRVWDTTTRETVMLPEIVTPMWRLHVVNGRSVVQYYRQGWRTWRLLTGDGAFNAGVQPMTLHTPSGLRRYRGHLVAARPSARSTTRDTVNLVWLEDYVKGVVPREMPASWSPAAVQAQAVAARTYASYELQHPRAGHYQTCDTTACQVYGGFSAEDPRSNAAVVATAGTILTYQGTPAFTQFSSSSGGWTSANQFSYLPAQADPYDGWSGNPNRTWTKTIDVARVERTWPGLGNLVGIRVTVRDGNGQWRGRVVSLVLDGSKRDITVSGNTFRSKLGLKSTWWAVTATKAT
jgi:SpoIID/LytB domain protein